MPIDPRIALGVQPFQAPDPFEAYGRALSLKNMVAQQEASGQAVEMNRMKLTQMKRQFQAEEAARGILTKYEGDFQRALPELTQTLGPDAIPIAENIAKLEKEKSALNEQQREQYRAGLKTYSDYIEKVFAAPPEARDQVYQVIKKGLPPELQQQLPDAWDSESEPLFSGWYDRTKKEMEDLKLREQKAKTVSAEQEQAGTAPVKPTGDYAEFKATYLPGYYESHPELPKNAATELTAYREWKKEQKESARTSRLLTPEEEAQQIRLRKASGSSAGSQATGDDARAIAEDIVSGLQPPTTTGLYRYAGPVRAHLAKMDFDLVKGQNEWNAVQKWIAAANSTQQLRLRQAVEKIEPHVEVIAGLYAQLEKKGLPSGYRIWNKAALAAARNLKGETGALAQNLETQIVDLSAELGNVYMGGNTPTDHALQQAAQNLKAEWNPETFKMAIDLIKKNVVLRRNAIRFTGPSGVPVKSPYVPDELSGNPEKNNDPLGIRK